MDEQLIAQLKEQAADLLEQGRIKDALPLIRQGAHWGDAELQVLALRMLLHGAYQVPVRPAAALDYARMAALNGSPEGNRELGLLILKPENGAADYEKARYFLEKAALAGDATALDALGMMELQAKGTPRNAGKALAYFEQAEAAIKAPKAEGVWKPLADSSEDSAELLAQIERHQKMAQAMIAKESGRTEQ